MKHLMRNVLLLLLVSIMLLSFAACNEQSDGGSKAEGPLKIETVKVITPAYLDEPYDIMQILLPQDGVKYSATARYTDVTLDPETNEYSFQEHELEVKDLYFTPVSMKDTIVTITAKRGKETATKIVSVATTVRADPLDDLYKSTGTLGWAEAGISKSVSNDSRYLKGEDSKTSLHVKFDGVEPHEWGQSFLNLSSEMAQKYFTDQIWSNAIVTFWVYNPMDQDIEFQLVINDSTRPVMTDWTRVEGEFRRQFAKAGEWTQIFFSLRRLGTTHRLINNQYSAENLFVKMQYSGFSLTQNYQFEFYLDGLDVVPGENYPEIDTTYTFSDETLAQGWENMMQDTGWQGASTIYNHEEMMGDESTCSLEATFNSDKGPGSPFVVLNPEVMLGTAGMEELPDMTGGTLTAYFKFEGASPAVNVDLVKRYNNDWKFSNVLPMTLTSVGNGWYKGTVDVYDFDFNTARNDDIIRIRFTFSGITKASKVLIDTVKFDYVNKTKIKEAVDSDWINLPQDSGMTTAKLVKFSTDYKKAQGSVRSLQITAKNNETGIMTLSPEYAVIDGTWKQVPNMTKGVVSAYFYFGDKNPEAYMRIYNSSWKYCPEVAFNFESVGDGWYYGTIPASLFQGFSEGNSSKIIRISILIPAGYTVYVDGLMHDPNATIETKLDPEDVFASGIFTTSNFTGNFGCEVTTKETNNSKDAIHLWAKEPIGWPDAGVRFATPVDISGYTNLSVDVKAKDSHPWIGIKLYYMDKNGIEQSVIVGADFAEGDWQTLSVKLNEFTGADLTKVTGILLCVNYDNAFKAGLNNQFWLDNLKLTKAEIKPGERGQLFKAGENTYIELGGEDYASISFEYKLITDGTMTLILRDPSWTKYFGDFTFDANGLVWTYQTGITCEKLDDGYIRVTMVMDELNRSGIVDNRDNAPETIGVFDIFSWTTADGYVDNIQTVLDTSEPDEPTEPSEPTDPEEPEFRGTAFTAGTGVFMELTAAAYDTISFEYKLITDGTIGVILRDPEWSKYYGDFTFDANGLVWTYQTGITCEKLDDGYIRITLKLDELNRSGCLDNLDMAPATVGILDIYGGFTTASGYIDNIQCTEKEPEEQPLEINFIAGQECFIEVTPGDYEAVVFDYKLESDGEMRLILRDPNWSKYYGDFTFDANGLVWTYQTGITCEKLDNGYIRVTMIMDELNRSGVADNRDNAPETIGVIDVYSWTTVDGHMTNIQLLDEVPAAKSQKKAGVQMARFAATKVKFCLDTPIAVK